MFSRYVVSAAQMGFLFTYAPSLYQAKSIKWQALEIKRRHPRIPLHCKQFPYFFKGIFKKVGKCSTCAQYAPHFPGTKIMLLIFRNRKNFANGILIYALFILQARFRKHFQVFSLKLSNCKGVLRGLIQEVDLKGCPFTQQQPLSIQKNRGFMTVWDLHLINFQS